MFSDRARYLLAWAGLLLLSGCLARDPVVVGVNTAPAGNWRIERSIDRITSAPISSAFVMSRSVSTSKIVFPPAAQLQLLCFKEMPVVSFNFPFKIGSTRNASFAYRFDDRAGREIEVRFVGNYRDVLIERPDEVAQFVDELSTSKGLYIFIRSLTDAGRTSAEFSLQGAPAAIKAAYATCPVQPAKVAQAPAPKKKVAGH
ncbi:MAG TPA: hypothetical protein VFL51_10520 [Pseudolabrys sp.]|nr:hypothetical protein [Pseudolabrys sp.]